MNEVRYTLYINASASAARPAEVFDTMMSQCVLFIDGENFLYKIKEVIKNKGTVKEKSNLDSLDLNKLFRDALKGLTTSRMIFYVSRLHVYPETKKKSEELIKFQRKMRNSLMRQGYEFVIAGNVRAQKVGDRVVFREKGVDVKIAVDLVALACDKKLDTAIVCSSDSDLQPAIAELRKRGVVVIYVGFESSPNKGLSYTTNRTVLLRDHEVVEAFDEE